MNAQACHIETGAPAPITPRSRRHYILMGGLTFALLGPPIGALALLAVMAGIDLWQGDTTAGELVRFVPALLIVLLFSYPVGVVPAALAGIAVGALQPHLVGWRSALAGAVAGGLSTLLCLLALRLDIADGKSLLFSTIGIVPGAVLAHHFFRRDAAHSGPGHSQPPRAHPDPQ